jgi:hypothetical protein
VLVVPFTDELVRPATVAAVAGSGHPHRFVAMDPGDVGAYGRLFRRLWEEGETFVIVEHDVVPTGDQLKEILTCGHSWCSYAYDQSLYPPGPYFGLVRFDSSVMAAHPRAADVALLIGRSRDQEAEWWHIDSLVARDLQIRGVPWTQHQPPVTHLHSGPPSGPPP